MKKISNTFYQIVQSGSEATLYIFDDITSGTPVVAELASLDVERIHVVINSYGGAAAEGMAIYTILVEHKAHIVTYNLAFACSAAATIFMAGDERYGYLSSVFLYHNAWGYSMGNADDMEAAAKDLRTISKAAESAYCADKLNISQEELDTLLKEDRFISAEEALEMGFATAVIGAPVHKRAAQSIRERVLQKMQSLSVPKKEGIEPPQSGQQEPAGEAYRPCLLTRMFEHLKITEGCNNEKS